MESILLGGVRLTRQAISGNYNVTPSDMSLHVDSGAVTRTLTLQDAKYVPGQTLFIKKTVAGNTVVLTPAAGLINGAASYTLYNLGASVGIQSDGVNWILFFQTFDGGGANPTLSAVPAWLKFTVTHTQLQAAALTNNITLFAVPAGGVLHATQLKHSTIFAGTGITDYKVSLGIAAELARYASAFDVDTAVTATNFQLTSVLDKQDNGAAFDLKIAAVSVGANLDQSTGGVLEIGLLLSACTLP